MRALVDANADPQFVADDDSGLVLFANLAATRLVGASDPLVGQPLPAIAGGTDRAREPASDDEGSASFERTVVAIAWQGRRASLITLRAIKHAPTEAHLRRINRMYAALSQVSSATTRAADEAELFDDACRISVAFGGFSLVWIGRPSADGTRVEPIAAAGEAIGYLDELRLELDPASPLGQGPVQRTLRIGVPYVSNDLAAEPAAQPWHELVTRFGLASQAVCPIRTAHAAGAVLVVYAAERGFFESDLLTLLHQIAAEVTGGLERLTVRAAQRRAESALAESELRLRQIAEASPHVFWMRDATNGHLLYVSPAFESVYGRPVATALAQPTLWTDVIVREDRARLQAEFGADWFNRPGKYSYRITRPDGSTRYVEEEVQAVFEENRLVRLTGSVADITERQRAEEQLQRFRSMIESSAEGFFVLRPDANFRFVFVNEAGVRHFGYPRERLFQMSVWEWDPKFTPASSLGSWATIKARGSITFETQHRRANGTVVDVEVTASYLAHGGEEFIVGNFRDISARARAQAVLRESEEKFRALFDEGADALLVVDPQSLRITDCNARALAMFDAKEKESLLARVAPSLQVTTFSDAERTEIGEQLAQHGHWSTQREFAALNGRRFWGALAIRRLSINGAPVHLVRISDITATRRLHELLAATQQLVRVGGWEYYLAEKQLVLTDEAYRIHELPIGTPLTQEQARQFLHPDARAAVDEAARECGATGKPWRIEAPFVTALGRSIWVRIDGRADLHEGKPWRMYGMIQDVSQEHAAAAVLREREEKLREQAMLIDEANDAIVLYALDQTILLWNRAAERVFGWTRTEVIGRNAAEFHLRSSSAVTEVLRTTIAHGIWNGDIEHGARCGRRLTIEARWTLIRDSAGAPKAVLSINTDVTEQRRMQANLLRAQRLESIGTLAGGIAHDLNNILAPIVLSADMLHTQLQGRPELELVDTIGASARRGAEVVRQVLSFARGVESTRVPVNLRHVITEIRKIVRETFPRTIACETAAPADLWTILADPTQLQQVLLNLGVNSRDAMPDGGVLRIEATNVEIDATYAGLVADASPGPYVRVRVIDTGSGIPPDIRDRIFEPFFTTKGVGKGTGLGLSTVLAIVRSHGGFLTLESELGHGTTFGLHFPAENSTLASAGAPPSAEMPQGKGELVLVIDDEQGVCSIIRQSLEGAGYRVLTAADGAEGVQLYVQRANEIALVLTDMMMPVMTGPAAIKALRRISPGVRIVAMSGINDTLGVTESAADSGSIRFLLKPFTLETLLGSVRAALDATAPAAAPQA